MTLMALIFPLQGSRPSDFTSDADHHKQIEPCPDSPNCTLVSKIYSQETETLFPAVSEVLKNLDPYQISLISDDHRIEAVFKIPLFGFKDDVHILVETQPNGSILHIRSASRVGHSDLGVNRRRVKQILDKIEATLNHSN